MKRVIRLALFVGTAACIFSFFGCRNKRILDGPGMINDLNWKAFTVARSDSYAQHNFSFTVERTENGYLLTGECRGEYGDEYDVEEGMLLPTREIQYLRTLNLGDLPDANPASPDELDDILILDAPTITLHVIYLDGTVQEKAMQEDFSIELYKRFLPYFEKYKP